MIDVAHMDGNDGHHGDNTLIPIDWVLYGCIILARAGKDKFRLTIDYEITNLTLGNDHAIAIVSPVLNIFCRIDCSM